MEDHTLLGIGIVGALVATVCCFTPVLAVLFAAVGVSATVGWLDSVLLPALLVFLGVVAYAVIRRRRGGPARTPEATR